MITWGINALNHDASIAVVENGKLMNWRLSSEFTGIKNDENLNIMLLGTVYAYGVPDEIVWYERPWLKKGRQLYAGQYKLAFDRNELPSVHLKKFDLHTKPITYLDHHLSHAAAGFLTSPYEEATVIVLDSIGEWESATIWAGKGTELTKLWSREYPTSLGMFYSAFTKLIGFTPLQEEHKLQELSAYGDPRRYYHFIKSYWTADWNLIVNFHKGVCDWPYGVTINNKADIAAAVQLVFEEQAQEVMNIARDMSVSSNLVFTGGCAANSKYANTLTDKWNSVWILDKPGDCSSSIGAALYKQKARHVLL